MLFSLSILSVFPPFNYKHVFKITQRKPKLFPESLALALRPSLLTANVGKASSSAQSQVANIAALVSSAERGVEPLQAASKRYLHLYSSSIGPTRGRILGRNLDKSLESLPTCYTQSPLQLCLEISTSSTHATSCSFFEGKTSKT